MEDIENYFKFKFRNRGFWFLIFLLLLQQQSTNASNTNKTFSLTEGTITHSGQLKRANGGLRNRNGVTAVLKSKVKKSHLHRVTPQNLYPPEDITSPNEDYFASYDSDYSMQQQQVKSNFSSLIYDNEPENAAIFPNPEMMVFESDKNDEQTQSSEPDVLPEVELPGNWLSDSDLRERDRIDSVEYVYYGASRGTGGSAAGRWNTPVVSGAGVSALILLGAGWALLKRKGFRSSKMFPVEMNMICCLLVTNVMLLVGVQDTAVQTRCEVIALLLHYMHLVCASWITVYCYVISDNVTKGCVPNLRYNYLFAYGVPAVLVLFFYAISIESYETKEYCWMSLEKGMLLGLMVPGTILILSNTLIAMVGLKAVSKKRQEGMASTIQARIAGVNKCGQLQAAKYTSTNSLASVESRRAEPTTADNKSRTFEDQGTVEGTSWMRTCSAGQILETLDHREPSLYRNDSFKIDLSNLSMDNLSWKSAEPEGIGDMRKCLNFALLLQPLFCVFWFMGVVALENANQPLPPFVFAFLWSSMHIFIFFRLTRVLPYIPFEADSAWSGTTDNPSSIADSTQQPSKSTDTIPLLVTKVESPPSISTISH